MLFGQQVHARAGGEIVRRLGAAVQHDDQRQRLPAIAARHVELVGAAPGLIGVGPLQELPPRPARCRRARRRPIDEASRFGRPPLGLNLSCSRNPRNASGMAGWPAACPERTWPLWRSPRTARCVWRSWRPRIDRLGDEVDSSGARQRWAFGAGVGVEGASDAVPPLSMRCKSAVALHKPASVGQSGRLDEGGVREMIHGQKPLRWGAVKRPRSET